MTDQSQRKRARSFYLPILEVFDGYVHGKLSRREYVGLIAPRL